MKDEMKRNYTAETTVVGHANVEYISCIYLERKLRTRGSQAENRDTGLLNFSSEEQPHAKLR